MEILKRDQGIIVLNQYGKSYIRFMACLLYTSIESLKDDYIVRAKAVSYIVDAKPQVENDVEELQKIAKLMSVDEIHLFDETGCINLSLIHILL